MSAGVPKCSGFPGGHTTLDRDDLPVRLAEDARLDRRHDAQPHRVRRGLDRLELVTKPHVLNDLEHVNQSVGVFGGHHPRSGGGPEPLLRLKGGRPHTERGPAGDVRDQQGLPLEVDRLATQPSTGALARSTEMARSIFIVDGWRRRSPNTRATSGKLRSPWIGRPSTSRSLAVSAMGSTGYGVLCVARWHQELRQLPGRR